MKRCALCNQSFDPEDLPTTPEVQAGLILTIERFDDADMVCGSCLASRGQLAMMYDPEFRR